MIIRKSQRISKLACCVAVLFLACSPYCTAEQVADNELFSEAVDVYRSRIEQGKLPNVILYVIQDGKVVLSEALGWRDKAAQAKMEADTLLRMASNTKAVVATAVLILQQRRLLSIYDRIPVAGVLSRCLFSRCRSRVMISRDDRICSRKWIA